VLQKIKVVQIAEAKGRALAEGTIETLASLPSIPATLRVGCRTWHSRRCFCTVWDTVGRCPIMGNPGLWNGAEFSEAINLINRERSPVFRLCLRSFGATTFTRPTRVNGILNHSQALEELWRTRTTC